MNPGCKNSNCHAGDIAQRVEQLFYTIVKGYMKSITATELRNKAAEVLEEISTSGKSMVVTRYGKPWVKLEALHSSRPRLGALRDRTTIVGA